MNLRSKELLNASKVRRVLLLLIFIFGVLGLAGALGGGYCDHQLRLAPRVQGPGNDKLILREYKGERRFITVADNDMCRLSVGTSFSGIGAACICAFIYFFLVGGLKEL
jgi:hypothetical protein